MLYHVLPAASPLGCLPHAPRRRQGKVGSGESIGVLILLSGYLKSMGAPFPPDVCVPGKGKKDRAWMDRIWSSSEFQECRGDGREKAFLQNIGVALQDKGLLRYNP